MSSAWHKIINLEHKMLLCISPIAFFSTPMWLSADDVILPQKMSAGHASSAELACIILTKNIGKGFGHEGSFAKNNTCWLYVCTLCAAVRPACWIFDKTTLTAETFFLSLL